MTPGEQAIVSLLEDQKRARRRSLLLKVLGITVGGVGAAYYGPTVLRNREAWTDSLTGIARALSDVPRTMTAVNSAVSNVNNAASTVAGTAGQVSQVADKVDITADKVGEKAQGGLMKFIKGS